MRVVNDVAGVQLEALGTGCLPAVKQVEQSHAVLAAGDGDEDAVTILEQAVVTLRLVERPEKVVRKSVGAAHGRIVPRVLGGDNRRSHRVREGPSSSSLTAFSAVV